MGEIIFLEKNKIMAKRSYRHTTDGESLSLARYHIHAWAAISSLHAKLELKCCLINLAHCSR